MDLVIRGISKEHNIKVSIADLSDSINEIIALQPNHEIGLIDYTIAQVTIGNTLLANELKNKEKMFTNIICEDGLVTKITAEYHDHKVRTSYRLNKDLENAVSVLKNTASNNKPVIGALNGESIMHVGRTVLNSDTPYYSSVNIENMKIADTFMEYLHVSDQITSLMVFGIKFDENKLIKSSGMLIQLLPGHTDADIEYIDDKLGNTNYISEVLIKSTNYMSLINDIINDAKILEQNEINFRCTCSKEKAIDSVKMIGGDIDYPIEVICEFCNRKYIIKE